jgi:hypothetical protein
LTQAGELVGDGAQPGLADDVTDKEQIHGAYLSVLKKVNHKDKPPGP